MYNDNPFRFISLREVRVRLVGLNIYLDELENAMSRNSIDSIGFMSRRMVDTSEDIHRNCLTFARLIEDLFQEP